MATQLVHLKDIERLSPRVIRILGGNPSKFTLQGTNTYLIGQGPTRILLDTGEGKPAWLSSLKDVLASESASIATTILTHWHIDHIGGVPDVRSLSPSAQILKHMPGLYGDEEEWKDISNGERFITEGATLRAVHCPGHTEDHMAFVLEEEDAMFAGDNVLGQGTAVFQDLKAYMESLEIMKEEFHGRIYPGHGPVIDEGKPKIVEYIEHRKQREKQVLEVLASSNRGQAEWTSMEIVKVVYKDVPEQLHVPAEGGVIQVLQKLEKDGRVGKAQGSNAWKLNDSSNL